ncbi:MAG: TIGR01777 family oxidoreductase [Acidimicrobiales bacterium]|nr:TIGR01777 family oxidoreductase [Acidimicrobiales bacterium]
MTGARGLIGTALTASLEADGHRTISIRRSGDGDGVRWDPAAGTIDAAGLEGVDAVVHLAGEPIAARPWTVAQRARIRDSRHTGTQVLAEALAGLDRPPTVLVSGSAIGFYGDGEDRILTESTPAGTDFLAEVCQGWEEATGPAGAAGIRVVTLRTGIVLDAHGGALAKQLPIFKLGLGGRAGRGDQWLAWITLHDEVRAIRFAIDHPELDGPLNLTAPAPATNAAFTAALGDALHRPTLGRIPRLATHLPFGIGPLVGSLLFTSARVVPERLLAAGFAFDDPDLAPALEGLVGRGGR